MGDLVPFVYRINSAATPRGPGHRLYPRASSMKSGQWSFAKDAVLPNLARPSGFGHPTSRTGVHFFNQPTQCRIDLGGLLGIHRVDQFLCVVIHLDATLGANHCGRIF